MNTFMLCYVEGIASEYYCGENVWKIEFFNQKFLDYFSACGALYEDYEQREVNMLMLGNRLTGEHLFTVNLF